MNQYAKLLPAYLNILNGTLPYVPPGTYTPFFTASPTTTVGFGYGSLVGIGQAFHVASATDVGQVTLYFQASGTVSPGYLTGYLYGDNVSGPYPSPSIYATPTGGPIAASVEVYNATDVAEEWASGPSSNYIALTFTFDFEFAPGYYWFVLGSNYPATPGNSLLLGISATAGLAFANGTSAGQDVTGLFGPNSQSGSQQIATILANKTSAPPLEPSNNVYVSGFGVLLSTLADRMQVLENAAFALDAGRQLFNGTSYPAVGAQLDGIGQIVGISRNGLSDAEYLIFILGEIGSNYSNGTIPEISTLVSLLFQTNTFDLLPLYPAEIDLQIPLSAGLQTSLYPQALTLVSKSVDAGVGIGFGVSYPANPFLLGSVGGPMVGGGLGDINNPSIGGGLASLFFNNPGV